MINPHENLKQHIVDELGYTVYLEEWQEEPESVLLVRTGGGATEYPANKIDDNVQVFARAPHEYDASIMSQSIYDLFKGANGYEITLPALSGVVGATTLFCNQVRPVQAPYLIAHEGGEWRYVFNLRLTYIDP